MTYRIIRFVQGGKNRVIKRGLSLEEAVEHCQDPKTTSSKQGRARSDGRAWFDGYELEKQDTYPKSKFLQKVQQQKQANIDALNSDHDAKVMSHESYPNYLRRVGDDYAESGMEATAEDYKESAQLIEDLKGALVLAVKQWSEGRGLYSGGKMTHIDLNALLKRVTR